ncbi:MAG: protein kinase, partial [Holophagae bacterium]|nr:protein kinase [Holophagae bacterium]
DLPVDKEAQLYRKISNKVNELNLTGLHKLLAIFPMDSDYLVLVGEIFPNTNGKMDQQLPEMVFLANEARKAGNLETALFVESQIISMEVNYLGESHLDKERYRKIIEESKRYRFFSTTIDLVSTLALHEMFRSDYEKSLTFAEEAENLSRRHHLTLQAGIYAGYMGICYSNLSQFGKALDSYEIACRTLKELNPEWYWIWKAKLASCYAAIGDTNTAETMFRQILKTELERGQSIQTQYTYRNLAELYIKRGELDKARRCLSKVNATAFPGLIKKNNAIFGRLAYASGNYRNAVTYINKCLTDKAPLDAATRLDSMIDLASAYQALGQNEKAELAYRNASANFEHLAATRFSNLTYRKGFFRQYHQLYLNYISFLVNVMDKPGKAWLLVRHLESGPFQYFSAIVLEHFRSILSFPVPKLPEFAFNKTGKNTALKKLTVRIEDAKTDGMQTILAGPGGVFQSDGTFYTQISTTDDIQQLAVQNGHWAGISRKDVVLDGELLPLPEAPDRILTAVQFKDGRLLVGSSNGLYRYSQKVWHLIYKEAITAMALVGDKVVVVTPDKGMILLKSITGNGKMAAEPLYPEISEIRDTVSFSRVSENQFVVFTPDKILILDKSSIIGKIPFPFGVIQKVKPFGTGRWLIFTVLNRSFILENGQLYQINMGKSHLLAGCSAGTTSFFSTDHTILVETCSPLVQSSLFREGGREFPTSMEKIGKKRIALGFRGEGITVHNMKDGSFLGLFPIKLEQFNVNGSYLTVLTSSGHVKTYSGNLPDNLKLEKTFYPSSPIQTMHQLATGSVIASFSGGGLVQWEKDRPPHFFGHQQGLPSGVTITGIGEHEGKLLLGSNEEVVPFDYRKTGTAISIPGKVTCFTEYEKKAANGTTSGAFLLKKTKPTAIFGNYTTGQVFDLDSTGTTLAAATANGVFVKTKAGVFHIPSPEQTYFVAVTENELLMVSKESIFTFKDVQLPILIQLGHEKYVAQVRNHPVFLKKDLSSHLLLDTGDSNMTPVSILKTESIELMTKEFSGIHVSFLPPFGGQPAYIGKPELLENGKHVSSTSLKPGIHHLVLAGSAPFNPKEIAFDLKLTRKFSFAWWISALLGIITVLLLVTRYFKWKKGRYIAHYKILKPLGEGGMGTVFHAKDIRSNHTVALKLLNRHVDPVMVERFKREWQILDKIKHPNIIEVFDRGEHMDRFFIAMEMLHGHTLDEILEKNGPLPEQAVIATATAVASSLEVIHREMIVHRDLKPSNIMYTRHSEKISGKVKPEEIKLMDFGVSKELLREGLTTDGSLVGTLLYVAPESLSNLTVDQRSDIYALGVTMYELLAGTPPFTDENQISIFYKILNSPPPPFPDKIPLSPGMKNIVLKCLNKDPKERYQNAAELIEALTSLTPVS